MEIVLGGDDLDAETAERWGYLNRIYAAADIEAKVSALANRIASFPVEAVRLGKAAVSAADLTWLKVCKKKPICLHVCSEQIQLSAICENFCRLEDKREKVSCKLVSLQGHWANPKQNSCPAGIASADVTVLVGHVSLIGSIRHKK
jgi:hypothetical protein